MEIITSRCPRVLRTGRQCSYPAGLGTTHPGYGTCNRHGGAWPQSEELWSKAMEIAKREDITPTDALLSLVRGAMGRASYVDEVLTNLLNEHVQDGGDPLNPPHALRGWMRESRQERMLAARTAKAAIDAGVMVAMAQRLELEGGLVADAVAAALDSLPLSPEDRMKALGAAQERLLNSE